MSKCVVYQSGGFTNDGIGYRKFSLEELEEMKMRVEEIALRQEIRQMLNEAGINKNTLRDMAEKVMQEEVEKQVKNAINQSNIDGIVYRKINSYELNEMMRAAIRKKISEAVCINIDVKATVPQKDI